MMVLKWILEKECVTKQWIQLAQIQVEWQAFVNKVMNHSIPKKAENVQLLAYLNITEQVDVLVMLLGKSVGK